MATQLYCKNYKLLTIGEFKCRNNTFQAFFVNTYNNEN